jgi:hypothetical protein
MTSLMYDIKLFLVFDCFLQLLLSPSKIFFKLDYLFPNNSAHSKDIFKKNVKS